MMKEFRGDDGADRINKLVKIYGSLKAKNVPYVSTLDSHGFNHESPCVVLSPLGRPVLPRSGEEVYNAVACVLQALKVRYEVPVFII